MRSGSRLGIVLVRVTRSVAFLTVSAYERRLAAGTGGRGRLEERGGLGGGPVVAVPPGAGRAEGGAEGQGGGGAFLPEIGGGCVDDSAVPWDRTRVTPTIGESLGARPFSTEDR